jgi:hypothetical protein
MSAVSGSANFNHGFPGPGPQRPTPQKVLNHVFFLSKDAWKDAREEQQFDYIVIGSGFCALAFAHRTLTSDPKARILILERGPFFLPEHFQNLPLPYRRTLGGLSETFPWTLSARTAEAEAGTIGWQHGMVPFFGGRSIMWSAWCPRPTKDEMRGWPAQSVAAANTYFAAAEALLNVVSADRVDRPRTDSEQAFIMQNRPVYGPLQLHTQQMLIDDLHRIDSATRVMPAPLAAAAGVSSGVDFNKFATPSVLLELADRQAELARHRAGSPLSIATECTVTRILHQDGCATALETDRGMVAVGEAQVVLAMGTLPPATLVLNSFPEISGVGEVFTAHFITALVARVPRADYGFADELGDLEMAAIYMAGESKAGMQYHVQLSVLSDRFPERDAQLAERYAPDVVATATQAQLHGSEDHLVFVCAVLGELDDQNPDNHLRINRGEDPTCNVTLQVVANERDEETWATMDEGTFHMLERVLSPEGASHVEYWHSDNDRHEPDKGHWSDVRPSEVERRVPGLVHEGSSLPIGESGTPVGLDYRLEGVKNVFVTGGALWPTGGSWNPTMTMTALAIDLADRLTPPPAGKGQHS